jgi:hypothetical protein
MSEASVVVHLLAAARALRNAEDGLRADTEYLRGELGNLLGDLGALLDKIQTEHALLDTRRFLHGDELRPTSSDSTHETGD